MAKKDKKKDKKAKKGFSPTYWILIGIAVAVAFSPSSFILISLGMMPTFIQLLTIRGRGQQQKATIMAMNAAGVLPYWGIMLTQADPLGRAIALLRDPTTWMVMWGAALFGMIMMWGGGKMAEAVIDVFARSRIEKLRKMQGELIDEYGEEIERDAMRYLTGQFNPEGDGGLDPETVQD